MEILPANANDNERLTRVRTRVRLESGAFAPVDYAFRKTEEGWKCFDVTVEGVSYVRNYRTELDAEIRSSSLDAVITRLEDEANATDG